MGKKSVRKIGNFNGKNPGCGDERKNLNMTFILGYYSLRKWKVTPSLFSGKEYK
jgi:hypothetical protein